MSGRHPFGLLAVLLLAPLVVLGLTGPVSAAPDHVVAAPTQQGATAAAPQSAPASPAVAIDEVDLAGPRISDVEVTVENTGSARVSKLSVGFAGPVGWLVEQTPITVKGTLKPGASVDVTFRIQVPSPRNSSQVRTFTATADYVANGASATTSATRTQVTGTPFANLAAAYDNVGITDESNTAPGNFDGDGNSFSAQALAAAGVTPGSTVEGVGATFTWPDVPAGEPDNVSASGETITFGGRGSALAVLGSAAGNPVGTVTVVYTDGTTGTGRIGFPNWCCGPSDTHGATPVVITDHRNTPSGPANFGNEYRVYGNTMPLDPSKTLSSVTLPSAAGMHVFAMALVS